MSIQIISTYKKFATDAFRGGQGTLQLILLSGASGYLLVNNDKLIQADGNLLLLSIASCSDFMLLAEGGDKVLLSGGTDKLLIGGYCQDRIVLAQRRFEKRG